MSNFAFLESEKQFNEFTAACLEAEKSLQVSPATCAILSRRALELAVKWLYKSDEELHMPYQDNLSSLIHARSFRDIIDQDLFPLLKYIIKLGNVAVHTNSKISREEAVTSLRNLHQFIDWISYCYSFNHQEKVFDETNLYVGNQPRKRPEEYQNLYDKLSSKDQKLEEMIQQNLALRKELTEKRKANTENYDYQVDQLSEHKTRKLFIDVELKLAGWEFGKNVIEEYPVTGMPNVAQAGSIDYALLGDNGKPIAIVEAKKTSVDIYRGKQQAKLYADCVEVMHGQRPIIFFTNGFDTRIWDDTEYPERKVSGFYTKEDVEVLISRRELKRPLKNININDNITNRAYQKEAITNVVEAINNKEREALLVMATGSGKTRTAISIVDVLIRHNWVKNILFLADRTALVKQAKKAFNELLPSLSLCNLLDNKEDPALSRMVFSTYPTMMNAIDNIKKRDGHRLFTVGHFDLIIIDESHRSIYRKYKAIFDYFDSLLIGLTATPKDEIDKNTYDIFGLETGNPTYAYELKQAVDDGYLVDYYSIEVSSKMMDDGLRYDDLSEEEKEAFEETFDDEVGDYISSDAINKWLFNNQTVDHVLTDLMEKGVKVEGGDRIGKTIIFAKNSKHAKHIVERFNKLYPQYSGSYCKQIDYSVNYVDTLIDDFATKDKPPYIAVSVDMLDTGIDIPEIVNLVFFKKVRSKSKFWQMIGRGTRLCPDLFGPGKDKEYFIIFDYLRNFEFFRENAKGVEGSVVVSLTQRLFETKLDIVRHLQHMDFQEEPYMSFRQALVEELQKEIALLNEEHFQVRMQLRYIHQFKNKANWDSLTVQNVNDIKEHIAPLILANEEEEMAKRFDLVMYMIMLAYVTASPATKPINRVINTAERLSELGTIPQIKENRETLQQVQSDEFWQEANMVDLDEVRLIMRDLVKFLEKEHRKDYYTNFTDEFQIIAEGKGNFYSTNNLQNYRKKVSQYLKEHQDQMAIYKLHHNKPLTKQDVEQLEHILWKELGTKEDYEKEFGETPITKLVRQTVGLNRRSALEAFSSFLSEERLNSNQIKFVHQIIDYIVANGYLEKKVLREDPFRSLGSITEIFEDKMEDAKGIINVIDSINANSNFTEGA
ncbi:DEAD/DEAH box helicase family protein [Virgibacillus dokdonensis]|uniref:DEAD/DEAH box helicase family protein n=1 Tax=Virgibacillus dokdonensis TaxID=302167 RepID=UPI00098A1975|nr:DEAD/DEAH box helicase family protein [Virgibacillus dokdonensis]